MTDLTESTTLEHSEVLNTLVGSKVYYKIQEAVQKDFPNALPQVINEIALDHTLAMLWFNYKGKYYIPFQYQQLVYDELHMLHDLSSIKTETFEEFISILKERKSLLREPTKDQIKEN